MGREYNFLVAWNFLDNCYSYYHRRLIEKQCISNALVTIQAAQMCGSTVLNCFPIFFFTELYKKFSPKIKLNFRVNFLHQYSLFLFAFIENVCSTISLAFVPRTGKTWLHLIKIKDMTWETNIVPGLKIIKKTKSGSYAFLQLMLREREKDLKKYFL